MKKIYMLIALFTLLINYAIGQTTYWDFDKSTDYPFNFEDKKQWNAFRYEIPDFTNTTGWNIEPIGNRNEKLSISEPNINVEKRIAKLKNLGRKKSATASDKATIVLIHRNIWGNGTGYQMLLDSDHNVFGRLFVETGVLMPEGDAEPAIYNEFEYKIPSNADGLQTTKNIILDGEGSVEIPEGIYDYCITRPIPNGGIDIASGGYGRQDDQFFEGGYIYTYELELLPTGKDNVLHQGEIDAGISELRLPFSGTDLDMEEVEIVITNYGKEAVSNFEFYYKVYSNNSQGNVVAGNYPGTLESGESYTHKFSQKADLSSSGWYTIEAWLVLENDQNSSNDRIKKSLKHTTLRNVPFIDNFTSVSEIEEKWFIIDGNEDGMRWGYFNQDNYPGTNNQLGFMTYRSSERNKADDYLISDPVALPAGDNHIKFYYSALPFFTEALEVLYGKSSNPEEMTTLLVYDEVDNMDWRMCAKNFNIPQAGNYCFAFRAISEANRMMLNIDEVTIASGKYEGIPDIAAYSVILPPSGCVVSSQSEVRAIVQNLGTAPINEFTLSYSINDANPVSQKFTETIEIFQKKEVTFNVKADFSGQGEYNIKLEAKCEGQEDESNDVLTTVIINQTSSQLPLDTDFSRSTDIRDWTPLKSNGWAWSQEYGVCFAQSENEPLISKCFTMEKGTYRLSYEYYAGFDYIMSGLVARELFDDFYVACGISGTDPATWKKISEIKNAKSDYLLKETVDFTIEELGEYSFAFVSTQLGELALKNVSVISGVHDIGFELDNMVYWKHPLSPFTPASHINGTYEFEQVVSNFGSYTEEGIKFEIKNNGETIGASENYNLYPDRYHRIRIPGTLNINNPKKDEKIVLIGEVSMTNTDHKPDNNTLEYTVQLTDTIFAYDNARDFSKWLNHTSPVGIGNIFTINKKEDLTSITVGFGGSEGDISFALRIYKFEGDNAKAYHYEDFERKAEAGYQTFVLPQAKEMEPGVYFFEIYQKGSVSLSMIYDLNPAGFFMSGVSGSLQSYAGYGYVCIRANFAKSYNSIQDNKLEDGSISLFYNSGNKSVEINSEANAIIAVSIYDISGKKHFDSGHLHTNSYQIGASSFAKGVYIVVVNTESGLKTLKFIVK